jgi:hypothetical protein
MIWSRSNGPCLRSRRQFPDGEVHAEVLCTGVRRRVIELCWAADQVRLLRIWGCDVYRWIVEEEVDFGERLGVRNGEHAGLSQAWARIKELEGELELTRKASCCLTSKRKGGVSCAKKDLPGD